jgi:hypothetical protein
MFDTDGVGVWRLERRAIGNLIGVECDHVGECAHPDLTSIAQL